MERIGEFSDAAIRPRGRSVIHRECFEIHRIVKFVRKNEPLAWSATSFPVLVEKEFQLSDDRNGALALRALRFVHMASPDGFFNSNFGAVVVLPSETSDLSLARAGESSRATTVAVGSGRMANIWASSSSEYA